MEEPNTVNLLFRKIEQKRTIQIVVISDIVDLIKDIFLVLVKIRPSQFEVFCIYCVLKFL